MTKFSFAQYDFVKLSEIKAKKWEPEMEIVLWFYESQRAEIFREYRSILGLLVYQISKGWGENVGTEKGQSWVLTQTLEGYNFLTIKTSELYIAWRHITRG